jgi:mannose-6-phosphate isomerase-like protein (cupin superfamily)
MEHPFNINKETLAKLLHEEGADPVSAPILDQVEDDLIAFADAQAIAPPTALRDKILGKLHALNEQTRSQKKLDLHDLPMLDPQSNWLEWKEVVSGIPAPTDFENIHMHLLEDSEQRILNLVFVREFVEEEVHHDLHESFLLLQGTCTCHITDEAGNQRSVNMQTGDYIAFGLGETHDVVITSSEPAIAILQWAKIAA